MEVKSIYSFEDVKIDKKIGVFFFVISDSMTNSTYKVSGFALIASDDGYYFVEKTITKCGKIDHDISEEEISLSWLWPDIRKMITDRLDAEFSEQLNDHINGDYK